MINNVVLVGRLTKDIDLKYTANGTAVGSFNLAVNRNFTNQNGNREADFINCVIWRKSAETFANYTRKGSLVGITGHIQTRNYENQQGNRVYVTEVVIDTFQLLESRETNQRREYHENAQQGVGSYQNNQGANYATEKQNGSNETKTYDNPFASTAHESTYNDDDLPF